jgi:uncharacterized membrane protein
MTNLGPLGLLHFLSALLAMGVGAGVLLLTPKGGRRHRQLGLVYVSLMLVLNVTALLIYDLFGGFGPFHAFAIFSLLGIVLGWRAIFQARAARARGDLVARSRWIEVHYYWITWSYVGLLAAAASETITRRPAFHFVRAGGARFGIAVAAATLLVCGIGAWRIFGAGRRTLAPFSAPATSNTAAETNA